MRTERRAFLSHDNDPNRYFRRYRHFDGVRIGVSPLADRLALARLRRGVSMVAELAASAMLALAPAPRMTPESCAARYPVAAASVERLAREVGIPARVVWAVVVVESGCDANLRGASGEVGLGQIIPRDQTRYPSSWFSDRPSAAELLDPTTNVRTIAYQLDRNARRFCGMQLDCALTVYNGGTRPSPRAWRYASRVLWLAFGGKP